MGDAGARHEGEGPEPPAATGALVSFRFDGSDRRSHLRVTGWKAPTARQPQQASEVLIGPDGEQAIAEAQRHVYLIRVPSAGGEAPTVSVAKPEDAAVPVVKSSPPSAASSWTGGRAVGR